MMEVVGAQFIQDRDCQQDQQGDLGDRQDHCMEQRINFGFLEEFGDEAQQELDQ